MGKIIYTFGRFAVQYCYLHDDILHYTYSDAGGVTESWAAVPPRAAMKLFGDWRSFEAYP
jgi:hypothetical protein